MSLARFINPVTAGLFLALATADVACSETSGAIPVIHDIRGYLAILGIGCMILWKIERLTPRARRSEVSKQQAEADLETIVRLLDR
jgi:hypothetical protein